MFIRTANGRWKLNLLVKNYSKLPLLVPNDIKTYDVEAAWTGMCTTEVIYNSAIGYIILFLTSHLMPIIIYFKWSLKNIIHNIYYCYD